MQSFDPGRAHSLGTESDWEEQLINWAISDFKSTKDEAPVVSVRDAALDIERSVMAIKFEKQKQAKQSPITNFFSLNKRLKILCF